MHRSKLVLAALAAVAWTTAASAGGLKVGANMQCKLTNVAEDAVLYSGGCRVTEEVGGSSTIYSVHMGSAEPFLFASSDGKKQSAVSDQPPAFVLRRFRVLRPSPIKITTATTMTTT